MQIAAAIGLSILYVGITLLLAGITPQSGFPWWFFGPSIVMACGGFIANRAAVYLPVPWVERGRDEVMPRSTHLSWRAALRIPAYLPMYLMPYYIIEMLRLHFPIGWVYLVLAPLLVIALVWFTRRRMREVQLLREGKTAPGLVDSREDTGDGRDRIFFTFPLQDGRVMRGRGWDLDYNVPVGSVVPVYYRPENPEDYVAATACWFETD